MPAILTLHHWIEFFTRNNGISVETLTTLFIISFTESCCFVIPPDFLLPIIAIDKPLWAVLFLTLFTIFASVVGAAFGYLIGQKGGQPVLHKFFKPEKTEKVEKMFQKYDVWAIGIAAFTPIPYKVFTISAGVFNLHFKRFMLVSIAARGLRYMLIAMISFVILKGKTVAQVEAYFHSTDFKLLTLGIAIAVIVAYVLYRAIAGSKKATA